MWELRLLGTVYYWSIFHHRYVNRKKYFKLLHRKIVTAFEENGELPFNNRFQEDKAIGGLKVGNLLNGPLGHLILIQ